jgi:Methyltransferase domain
MANPMAPKIRLYSADSRHFVPMVRDFLELAARGATQRKDRRYLIDLGRDIRQLAFNMRDPLPVLELADLNRFLGCTNPQPVVLPPVDLVYHAGLGFVVPYSLLASVVSAMEPRRILEIGTFRGVGALTMALNAPDAEIYTIDLPSEVSGENAEGLSRGDREWVRLSQGLRGAAFIGHPASKQIHQIFANSLTMDVKEFIESADFCFIDGGHSYDCIKADTENALKVLSPNGVIVWDDYSWFVEGVGQYLLELAQKLPLKRIFGSQFVIYRREA